jgi:hypothetical protein
LREEKKDLTLPAVAAPKPVSSTSDEPVKKPLLPAERILTLIFVFTTGAAFAWNTYSKRTARRDKEHVMQAVLTMRDRNDRIFSSMREEFEFMVQNLDEKL